MLMRGLKNKTDLIVWGHIVYRMLVEGSGQFGSVQGGNTSGKRREWRL